MKRFLVAASFALTTLVSFTAAAVDVFMPNHIVDRDDGESDYWCQSSDLGSSMCTMVAASDDGEYVLIKDSPGYACADNTFGVINTNEGTGMNVDYAGGECKGDINARFVRNENHQLYVQIYNGKHILGNYPVH